MSSRRLDIVVAGAGIGGLTAAIALRRSGHKVTIYERASLAHEVGQGITISPNGGRILADLGLDFGKARMLDFVGTNVVSAETLESLAPFQDNSNLEQQCGILLKTAYRIDLHAALVELATRDEGEGRPVKVVTRSGVASFDGENGAVVLESGETVTADLIVASDGVKSTAAEHINGPGCPPLESSDTIVYRFTLTKEEILSDPLTMQLLDAGSGVCTFNVSSEGTRWLVRYWCRSDGLQNFAHYALRNPDEIESRENELRYKSDKAHLLKEMLGFHPALLRVAEMTTEVLPLWRCTTRDSLRTLHRGRLVVIGDASHPGSLILGKERSPQSKTAQYWRVEINAKLRIPRVAAYKYYSDIPFFRNAVDEQRDKCEKFMKPEDLPATQIDLRP